MKKPDSRAGRIRAAFEKLGWDTMPVDIRTYLGNQGLDVDLQPIAQQKFLHKHVGYVQLNTVNKPLNTVNKSSGDDITVSQLKEVKLLKEKMGSFVTTRWVIDHIEKLGGIERFREMLNVLESFSK
jgi:hypothetical protein